MGLKDDLESAPKKKSGPPCATCDWFNNQDKAFRQEFLDYVSKPNYVRALLHRVISEKYGYESCESSLKYCLNHHHGSR